MVGKRKPSRAKKRIAPADKLSPAEDAFLAHAQKIMDGYGSRRVEDARRRFENARRKDENDRLGKGTLLVELLELSPPFDQAEGFLKRESYSLIMEYIRKNNGKAIRSIVRRFVGEPRYPDYPENPFYWGLMAIDSRYQDLGARRISKYAQQLHYAHKNHVPPKFLVGFLYQIRGAVDLKHLLLMKHRDPSLSMQIPLVGPRSDA